MVPEYADTFGYSMHQFIAMVQACDPIGSAGSVAYAAQNDDKSINVRQSIARMMLVSRG